MKTYRLLLAISIVLLFSLALIGCGYVSGEMNDYENRLSEFFSFYNEVYDIEQEYFSDVNELMVKFNSEIENPNKQLPYAELLIEKYGAWYKDLSLVKVPGF